MIIQSIRKMIGQIGRAILTALYEGLVRFGCGMANIPYPEETHLRAGSRQR